MKNFNILGVHWKIRILGGEFTKNQYRRGDYLKRGAWTVWRFRGEGVGAWEERWGGDFEVGGVDTPMLTMFLKRISTTRSMEFKLQFWDLFRKIFEAHVTLFFRFLLIFYLIFGKFPWLSWFYDQKLISCLPQILIFSISKLLVNKANFYL